MDIINSLLWKGYSQKTCIRLQSRVIIKKTYNVRTIFTFFKLAVKDGSIQIYDC
jgi:hypothetical protein